MSKVPGKASFDQIQHGKPAKVPPYTDKGKVAQKKMPGKVKKEMPMVGPKVGGAPANMKPLTSVEALVKHRKDKYGI